MIGYIYKIKCNITNEIYIGSTINYKDRIKQHKDINNSTSSSKNIIEKNNYNFYILEKKEFPNNLSLKLLENLYIIIGKKYCKCINRCLAYSPLSYRIHYKKMYYKNNKYSNLTQDQKDKIKISSKKYHKKNRESNNKKSRERWIKNIESHNRKVCCKFCKKEMLYRSLNIHIKRKHS
jgi:hypothetical protein